MLRAALGPACRAHFVTTDAPDAGRVKPMVEKLVTATKRKELQEAYDLTVDELLRLGREEGFAEGFAKGFAEGFAEERARRLADLREMARAVLPAEVAKALESIDDPDLLQQELTRRLRRP